MPVGMGFLSAFLDKLRPKLYTATSIAYWETDSQEWITIQSMSITVPDANISDMIITSFSCYMRPDLYVNAKFKVVANDADILTDLEWRQQAPYGSAHFTIVSFTVAYKVTSAGNQVIEIKTCHPSAMYGPQKYWDRHMAVQHLKE